MSYLVYGKRTKPIKNSETGEIMIDKVFRALNYRGIRVNKLEDADTFATKEDAQEWIDKHNWREGVELEIRKAK